MTNCSAEALFCNNEETVKHSTDVSCPDTFIRIWTPKTLEEKMERTWSNNCRDHQWEKQQHLQASEAARKKPQLWVGTWSNKFNLQVRQIPTTNYLSRADFVLRKPGEQIDCWSAHLPSLLHIKYRRFSGLVTTVFLLGMLSYLRKQTKHNQILVLNM